MVIPEQTTGEKQFCVLTIAKEKIKFSVTFSKHWLIVNNVLQSAFKQSRPVLSRRHTRGLGKSLQTGLFFTHISTFRRPDRSATERIKSNVYACSDQTIVSENIDLEYIAIMAGRVETEK